MQALPQLLWLRCLKSIIDFSPLTVAPETFVSDAIALMAKRDKSALVVSDGQVLGWLTQQDVVRLVATEVDFRTTTISEVMHQSVMTFNLGEFTDIFSVFSRLRDLLLSLLPVVDEQDKLLGTVTSESICQVLEQLASSTNGETQPTTVGLPQGASAIMNANNSICTVGTAEDIQQSQQALQMLIENEQRFRTLVEQAADALFLHDKNGKIFDVNQRACLSLGYSREELLALSVSDIEQNFRSNGDGIWELLKGDVPVSLQGIHKRKDGTTFPVEVYLGLLELSGQQLILATVRDITERQQAIAAVEESATRFKLALETTDTIYWERNLHNDQILCMYRVDDAIATLELTYSQVLAKIHPDDREKVDRAHQNAIADLGSLEMEHRTLVEDHENEYKWLLVRGKVIADSTGKPERMIGFSLDITRRWQSDTALRESERRFRAIFNGTFQLTALLTPEGMVLEVNQTALDFVGWEIQDIVGLPASEMTFFIVPESQKLQQAIAIAARGEFIRYQMDILGADGTMRTIDFSLKPIKDETGKIVLLIAEGRDISELKQTQVALQQANAELERRVTDSTEALKEMNRQLVFEIADRQLAQEQLEKSEECFRFLAESIPQQVWIARPDGYIEYANQRTLDYFACSLEQFQGWVWQQWLHPEDVSPCLEKWQTSLATGTPIDVEYRWLRRTDNTYRWHLSRALPLRNQQGNIVNWFGTNTDIHDRVCAEISLRESEQWFQTLAAISPVGIFRTDAAGNCLYVNGYWCEIADMTPDEATGIGWLSVIHPEDRDRINQEWYAAAAQRMPFRSEYRIQRPDGSVSWVFGQAVPELGDRGEIIAYVGSITDINERKRAEQALAERVRLADFRADVDAILTQSDSLEVMMRRCTEAVVKHLEAAFARIWILNTKENLLELQVSAGIYTQINGEHQRVPVGKLKIGLIAQEGKPYLTNSIQDDPHISNKQWAQQEGMIAFAGYPLIVEGEILGVIALFSRQAIAESTFNALGIAADEIAIGIKRKQTEAALRNSEERFRNLVEASSDWVWEVDENGIYTYASPKVRDILGYEPQEILGKTPFELMPFPEAERVGQIFASIVAEKQPFKCLENINIHRDGRLVVLETSGVPFFDIEGRFRGYRGMDRDITSRKQAELTLRETQERLQAILDHSPALICVLDLQDRYKLVNHQFEKLFNLTQEQIIDKSIYDIWPDHIAQRLAVHHLQVRVGGIPLENEKIVQHEDGLHTYISVKFPLKDADGDTYAICGISTDITERKHAEEELRDSVEQFRLLVEGVKDYAIYLLDPVGLVMSWNSGAECITGYNASEIIGQNFSRFFSPEDIADAIPNQHLEAASVNGRCESEGVLVRKDGSRFWANCIITTLRDDNGKLRGFAKVTRDITERKLVEESLLRLRKAIESTSDAVSIVDITGQVIYVNHAFNEIFDYTCEQLNAAGGSSAIFRISEVFTTVFETLQTGESWRGEVIMGSRTAGNLQIDLRSDAIKDTTGKIVSFVSIYTDITQRKLIEEGLRLRDRAIAASSNGIVIADATISDGPIIYVNPAFERMTGYLSAEVIGQNFRLLPGADINQLQLQQLRAAMQQGTGCTLVFESSRKDGTLFWNELNISPVYDTNSEITHYIGIQTDITERKQAETALLVSQQRLQYLLTSSPAVIYSCQISENFAYTFVSPNVKEIMGYEAEQFLNNPDMWWSMVHHQDKAQVLSQLSNVIEQGEYKLEYRCLHLDNNYRWIYDKGKLIRDEAGNPIEFVGYLSDITDRKQLEQELRVALDKEKELNELKSRFISMTSHEFRTPLSTILSSSELLEHYRHKWTEEKQLTHLHRIQTAVKRMTEMLSDVLLIGKAESGKLEYQPTNFDLIAYCHNLLAEIEADFNNQIMVNFTSDLASKNCCMDDKLLGHILSNLLSNAIKYSPCDNPINFTLTCEDEQAIFEIQDQGIGIPPEDIPHLFESFHRASNVGNIMGTGLGLAIVKKCLEAHNGTIQVSSILEKSTVFTVKLPLNDQHC